MNDAAQHIKATWLAANQPRNAVIDGLLILIALAVVTASLFMQSINPETNWFMRSGAVIVLLGAIMEFRHNALLHSMNIDSIRWASGVGGPVIFEPTALRRCLGYIAHLFVVLGTFIAAYGDLLV